MRDKMKSIDQNNAYKAQKKIEKEKKKLESRIAKRVEYYKRQKEKKLEDYKKKLDEKYAKVIERYKKKQNSKLEYNKRKLEWKKIPKKLERKVKKMPSIEKIKHRVLSLAQLYARLRDSDENWYWKCISCWKRVHRTKWDGWHYISRANMSTAFNLNNINLQCKHCNWMLHWNIQWYRANLINKIWEEEVKKLEESKNQTRHRTLDELNIMQIALNTKIKEEYKKKNELGKWKQKKYLHLDTNN